MLNLKPRALQNCRVAGRKALAFRSALFFKTNELRLKDLGLRDEDLGFVRFFCGVYANGQRRTRGLRYVPRITLCGLQNLLLGFFGD